MQCGGFFGLYNGNATATVAKYRQLVEKNVLFRLYLSAVKTSELATVQEEINYKLWLWLNKLQNK